MFSQSPGSEPQFPLPIPISISTLILSAAQAQSLPTSFKKCKKRPVSQSIEPSSSATHFPPPASEANFESP